MTSELARAVTLLLDRERPSVVGASGLLFARLAELFRSSTVGELLESHRNGVWGDPCGPGEGYPILRSTNMRRTKVDTKEPAWCQVDPESAARFGLMSGDILITKSSGSADLVGKAALFDDPNDGNQYLFSNFLLRLRPNQSVAVPEYLAWFLRSPQALAWRGNAQQNAVGLRNLQTTEFLTQAVALPPPLVQRSIVRFLDWVDEGCVGSEPELPPPLAEQRRIVARLDALAAKIEEVRRRRDEVDRELSVMLVAAYRQITDGAPARPLKEVAPLVRRPATINVEGKYPQVSVRSFGRGSFHKPPLSGEDITWQKPFLVKAGDILVSNIKAWEGAIAVARPEDDGRFGSHRYLTFVPLERVATAQFVCFHLLTPKGLFAVGEASPGSADRNRTLGTKAFLEIAVPVPPYEKQLWFDGVCAKVDAARTIQQQALPRLDALLPAILDRAYAGVL